MIPLVESILSLAANNKNSVQCEDLEKMVELVEAEVQENVGTDSCRAGMMTNFKR